MSKADCKHIPTDLSPPVLSGGGCETCLAAGKKDWVHLRFCQTCGSVGCCNDSPGKHASAHYAATGHPLMRSFEPGEEWWWCFVDETGFVIDDLPPSPAHDGTR